MYRVLLSAGVLLGLVAASAVLADTPKEPTKLEADKAHAAKDGHATDGHAKDSHPKDAHAKDGHDEGHQEESLLSISADLGIWTVVVFVLLMLILRRLAWKPMLEGLQKREQTIQGALDEAQKARDEAQRLRAQLQKEMDNAAETVRGILEEARRDAQHTTEDMINKARQEINTERDRLQREMGIAKDQALQELWNQAANLATLISAKTIRRNLTPDDHRRLIDEALADLKAVSGHGVKEVTKLM
jgi:F-type H+-transporting ATPase subunit b